MNKKPTYMVTGASGLLGTGLLRYLSGLGHDVVGLRNSHDLLVQNDYITDIQCDLSDFDAAQKAIVDAKPDIIIHAAGLTNVDECEKNEDKARLLNVKIPEVLAQISAKNNIRYVFISSDHVTNGTIPCFSEGDATHAMNMYARSKIEAEAAVLSANSDSLVVRTNFFCKGSNWRSSLTDWLWGKANAGETIPAFTDSFFTPIAVPYLARALYDLSLTDEAGLIHVGGAERISKYDFALAFVKYFGFDAALVQKSLMAEAGLSAPRPMDMSMSVEKVESILGYKMPRIEESFEAIGNDYHIQKERKYV